MTTITMSRGFDQALAEVAAEAQLSAARALAEHYEFDLEEAVRFLALDEIKIVKKRGPIPKAKGAKKATKAGEEKPKRRTTGYLMFSAATRPAVKAEMTEALDEDEKLAPQEVVRELAKRWKGLGDEEKLGWNQRALEAAGIDSGEEVQEAKPTKEAKKPKEAKPKAAAKPKPAAKPAAPMRKIEVLLSDSEDSDSDDEME